MLHSTTVLAYYIFDDYWTCRVLVEIYKNTFWDLIPLDLPLNTALINHVADVGFQMLRHPAPGALTFTIY